MSQRSFATLRAAALDQRARNIFYKTTQVEKLHAALLNDSSAIQEAIVADSGVTTAEAKVEYSLALESVRDRYSELDAKKDLEDEYRIANGKDAPDASVGAGAVVGAAGVAARTRVATPPRLARGAVGAQLRRRPGRVELGRGGPAVGAAPLTRARRQAILEGSTMRGGDR